MAKKSREGRLAESTGPDTAAPQGSAATRIRLGMDLLSPGEKRIARVLLSDYPAAGLDTTSSLAARAHVSAPTVVRFVSRLGYGGYRDFQNDLRKELQERQASPLTLPTLVSPNGSVEEYLARTGDLFSTGIQETLRDMPLAELDAAVRLLSGPRTRIHSIGGGFTQVLAKYLDLHLRRMKASTNFIEGTAAAQVLLDLDRHDCLVVFDMRRYQDDIVRFAQRAHEKKASIILVTDPWLSPIAEFADAILSVRVLSPSPFDSFVPATALVETLVARLHHQLGESGAARMEAYDAAVNWLASGHTSGDDE